MFGENGPGMKMYFMNIGIFHCYVSLPEGIKDICCEVFSIFIGGKKQHTDKVIKTALVCIGNEQV